ncbi:hypothetical protein T492DRAFT_106190 [Pavlovales sp. CCMP2436]|nr:hypothetical protein T492DRAFT_106190 [Pavlovales sp. CCMP2436]
MPPPAACVAVSPSSIPCLIAVPLALVLLLVARSISSPSDVSRVMPALPGFQAAPFRGDAQRGFRGDAQAGLQAAPSARAAQLAAGPTGVDDDFRPSDNGAVAAADFAPVVAALAVPTAVARAGSQRPLFGPDARGSNCQGPLCSVGKVAPHRAGDLELPGELEKAVRARSYGGELIITYANEAGSAWVGNLALSLRDVGIEHFFLIMMTQRGCDGLYDSPSKLSCGWSSWDLDGCKSEKDKTGATERMWFIRHYYLARIIELGSVNVMALDGDMTINAMPYAALHVRIFLFSTGGVRFEKGRGGIEQGQGW